MSIRILVMGLPGSGKTTISTALKLQIEAIKGDKTPIVEWFNADNVRKNCSDWDFSVAGRMRQSVRMLELSTHSDADYVICDFVAPLQEMRNTFNADWIVWMDTVDHGRFEDTNKSFLAPAVYDFRITEMDADKWAAFIADHILADRRRPVFDWRKETVQQLGRWQPWHQGHRALFERLLQHTGQVMIQVRDVQGWQDSNPFGLDEIKNRIQRDLDPLYQGQFDIQIVPNIVHIGWGRGVGYTSGEELFATEITQISGTQIRAELGLK